jgi:hypothetical protein
VPGREIFVTVCRMTIEHNRTEGTRTPPIVVWEDGAEGVRVNEWTSPGRIRLVYDPDRPRPDGAVLWMETIPEGSEACPST